MLSGTRGWHGQTCHTTRDTWTSKINYYGALFLIAVKAQYLSQGGGVGLPGVTQLSVPKCAPGHCGRKLADE